MNIFEKAKQTLDLDVDPVGVKLIYNYDRDKKIDDIFKIASKARKYCEHVKEASKGQFLKINQTNLSCDTAEAMLGFIGSNNLELTMKLDMKGLEYILLFPINKYFIEDYDCIILILNPRNCMNIIQAYVRLYKKPLKITCGVINGVCSEITAFVIKRNEVNFSFLCPNSRINATFDDCEMMCGIPNKMAFDIIEEMIFLSEYQKSAIII